MRNPNASLPENLKMLIENLTAQQAIPLGELSGIPFLAVTIPSDKDAMLDATVLCDMRPAIFNIDLNDETIAICLIRFRLNNNEAFTYTAIFDLQNEKQYNNCYALLGMEKFGLLVASKEVHDFLAFENNFGGEFNPRDMIAGAKQQATDYTPDDFGNVIQAFYSQTTDEATLWRQLEPMTPTEHKWYGRMKLELEPKEA